MRYDLRILWVDDTETFYNDTKDILEMMGEDIGITLTFDYIESVSKFNRIKTADENGFKLYDIFFVDYNLSDKQVGSDLIRTLRKEKMDSDVLFYSSEYEKKMRETVREDLGSFEGVYIANRGVFVEKAYHLINKNARHLTTLSNIRGFLMDQTSENDYTIKSYILRKFDCLEEEQKDEISKMMLKYMIEKRDLFQSNIKTAINKIQDNGISNINQTMNLMDQIFPISLKYQIFQKMIEFNGEQLFQDVSIEQYISDIVKTRNNLAHKKLDVCNAQKYILYYDTIKQFETRQCTGNCAEHSDDNKYSLEEWDNIRKKVHEFGKSIDIIQGKL